MNILKIAMLAFALCAAWIGTAAAASIDYDLTIPLIDVDAVDMTPTSLLRGTLSYDEDAMSGSGAFTFSSAEGSFTDLYQGFAFMLPDGADTGILFDGATSDGWQLFFNIVAGAGPNGVVSDPVNLCAFGCAMFRSVGATMTLADLSPITLPGIDPSPALPGGGAMSPVPLPPGALLFGLALLGLGGLAAVRRSLSVARPAPARGA